MQKEVMEFKNPKLNKKGVEEIERVTNRFSDRLIKKLMLPFFEYINNSLGQQIFLDSLLKDDQQLKEIKKDFVEQIELYFTPENRDINLLSFCSFLTDSYLVNFVYDFASDTNINFLNSVEGTLNMDLVNGFITIDEYKDKIKEMFKLDPETRRFFNSIYNLSDLSNEYITIKEIEENVEKQDIENKTIVKNVIREIISEHMDEVESLILAIQSAFSDSLYTSVITNSQKIANDENKEEIIEKFKEKELPFFMNKFMPVFGINNAKFIGLLTFFVYEYFPQANSPFQFYIQIIHDIQDFLLNLFNEYQNYLQDFNPQFTSKMFYTIFTMQSRTLLENKSGPFAHGGLIFKEIQKAMSLQYALMNSDYTFADIQISFIGSYKQFNKSIFMEFCRKMDKNMLRNISHLTYLCANDFYSKDFSNNYDEIKLLKQKKADFYSEFTLCCLIEKVFLQKTIRVEEFIFNMLKLLPFSDILKHMNVEYMTEFLSFEEKYTKQLYLFDFFTLIKTDNFVKLSNILKHFKTLSFQTEENLYTEEKIQQKRILRIKLMPNNNPEKKKVLINYFNVIKGIIESISDKKTGNITKILIFRKFIKDEIFQDFFLKNINNKHKFYEFLNNNLLSFDSELEDDIKSLTSDKTLDGRTLSKYIIFNSFNFFNRIVVNTNFVHLHDFTNYFKIDPKKYMEIILKEIFTIETFFYIFINYVTKNNPDINIHDFDNLFVLIWDWLKTNNNTQMLLNQIEHIINEFKDDPAIIKLITFLGIFNLDIYGQNVSILVLGDFPLIISELGKIEFFNKIMLKHILEVLFFAIPAINSIDANSGRLLQQFKIRCETVNTNVVQLSLFEDRFFTEKFPRSFHNFGIPFDNYTWDHLILNEITKLIKLDNQAKMNPPQIYKDYNRFLNGNNEQFELQHLVHFFQSIYIDYINYIKTKCEFQSFYSLFEYDIMSELATYRGRKDSPLPMASLTKEYLNWDTLMANTNKIVGKNIIQKPYHEKDINYQKEYFGEIPEHIAKVYDQISISNLKNETIALKNQYLHDLYEAGADIIDFNDWLVKREKPKNLFWLDILNNISDIEFKTEQEIDDFKELQRYNEDVEFFQMRKELLSEIMLTINDDFFMANNFFDYFKFVGSHYINKGKSQTESFFKINLLKIQINNATKYVSLNNNIRKVQVKYGDKLCEILEKSLEDLYFRELFYSVFEQYEVSFDETAIEKRINQFEEKEKIYEEKKEEEKRENERNPNNAFIMLDIIQPNEVFIYDVIPEIPNPIEEEDNEMEEGLDNPLVEIVEARDSEEESQFRDEGN